MLNIKIPRKPLELDKQHYINMINYSNCIERATSENYNGSERSSSRHTRDESARTMSGRRQRRRRQGHIKKDRQEQETNVRSASFVPSLKTTAAMLFITRRRIRRN